MQPFRSLETGHNQSCIFEPQNIKQKWQKMGNKAEEMSEIRMSEIRTFVSLDFRYPHVSENLRVQI